MNAEQAARAIAAAIDAKTTAYDAVVSSRPEPSGPFFATVQEAVLDALARVPPHALAELRRHRMLFRDMLFSYSLTPEGWRVDAGVMPLPGASFGLIEDLLAADAALF